VKKFDEKIISYVRTLVKKKCHTTSCSKFSTFVLPSTDDAKEQRIEFSGAKIFAIGGEMREWKHKARHMLSGLLKILMIKP
jgi:hypothetical protein